MKQRAEGFTLIEILVVLTIIAALSGLVVAMIPLVLQRSDDMISQNNLSRIGGMLVARKAGHDLNRHSGAAFLLQVAGQVKDEDLEIFLDPAEPPDPENPRPEAGTPEFVAMYREEMDLGRGRYDHRHTSYAGPDWSAIPASRRSTATLLWACDKCRRGVAHRDGITVLYDSGKTEVLALRKLAGHEPDGPVAVGRGSGDPRLAAMTYFPER